MPQRLQILNATDHIFDVVCSLASVLLQGLQILHHAICGHHVYGLHHVFPNFTFRTLFIQYPRRYSHHAFPAGGRAPSECNKVGKFTPLIQRDAITGPAPINILLFRVKPFSEPQLESIRVHVYAPRYKRVLCRTPPFKRVINKSYRPVLGLGQLLDDLMVNIPSPQGATVVTLLSISERAMSKSAM
jgi:hypothetical protein